MRSLKTICYILFILITLAFLLYIERHPVYNWDMIAYMGVVEEYDGLNIEQAHDSVYNILKRETPDTTYIGLTKPIEDRYECLVNVNAYQNELGFFRTKPLYTFLVFVFYKLGVNLVTSTFLPSFLSCFLLMLLTYHWLNKVTTPLGALITATMLLLLPKLGELCRLSSPDALSNMLILFSLYLLNFEARRKWLYVVLALCLLARIDNFIFVIVVLGFLHLRRGKALLKPLLVLGLISVLSIVIIPMIMGDSYDWFMNFAFLFSVNDYVQHWRFLLYDFRYPSYLFLVIVSVILFQSGDSRTLLLTKIIVITFSIRCILFPSLQERFFVAYEFGLVLLLVQYASSIRARHRQISDT